MSERLNNYRGRLLKWSAIAIGVLIMLVLIAFVIGMLLPQSHVATRSVRLDAATADVWNMVTNVRSAPMWRKDIIGVDTLPSHDNKLAWRERTSHGAITYEGQILRSPTAAGPGAFVSRIMDKDLAFGGMWTTEVIPDGTGTRVTITEHGEVYNPVIRFVSRYIMGHTATIDAYLRALGKYYGESVKPATVESVAP